MKISVNWIKDYVSFEYASPQALLEAVTLSTCEVEGYEVIGAHLPQIKVAEVLSYKPHPEADKLRLVTIDHGAGKLELVCGASNFEVGDKVAFAGLGVTLPGDFTIKKAKIRGIESEGMLCAEDELGFSDDHEGLMLLPKDVKNGTPLSELFPDHMDLVLEVDNKSITHRPDLWGHYGFAREFGAIFRKPIKPFPANAASLPPGNCPIAVEIKEPKLVYRYSGLSLEHAQIVQSPAWMRHRLYRVGLRALNNAVDVTNYVMLDLGQPMHAFDQDKIPGQRLSIHKAQAGTKLMTLYDKEVELTPADLLISDAQGPNVLAGVIGGKESGVSPGTKRIFLEAASWDPVTVRQTTSRIGLRTDSSQRFEKTLDPEMTLPAIARAVELLRLTCPQLATQGGVSDQRGNHYPATTIAIAPDFVRRRLGKEIPDSELADIFTRLGFGLDQSQSTWKVEVPSFRRTKDISIPEDLVEEVGRIHGFNNIPPQPPVFPIKAPQFNRAIALDRRMQALLSANGFYEVYNYPLSTSSVEEPFGFSQDGVMRMVNPVAETQDMMRTQMLPHFALRMRQLQKDALNFQIFELGRTYRKEEGQIVERYRLMLGLSLEKGEVGAAFYRLKAHLERLFNLAMLGSFELAPKTAVKAFQHKYIAAEILKKDQSLGELYQLTPAFQQSQELKGQVAFAEIDLNLLLELGKEEYFFKEGSKFPPVHFELSVVVPSRTPFGKVKGILENASKRVKNVRFLDNYDLGNGTLSMSVAMSFQALEKTLEPEEIKSLQDKMIQSLEKEGYHLR